MKGWWLRFWCSKVANLLFRRRRTVASLTPMQRVLYLALTTEPGSREE